MMNNSKRYWKLASKWLKGTITEAEKAEFSAWYNGHADDHLELPALFSDSESALKDRILTKVKAAIANEDDPFDKKRSLYPRIVAVAAILLLALSVGIYFWNHSNDPVVTDQLALHDVQPGTNKATLLLADGRAIDLSSDQSGIIVGESISYNDGSSVFGKDEQTLPGRPTQDRIGTQAHDSLQLTTPKGGTYQVTLPDGSKVWLNAASSIRYPSSFSSKHREVELLYGEAYFEVRQVKNPRMPEERIPFVVKTRDQDIEVLGTQFNVNAYEDARGRQIQTTLVEGAVRIHHPLQGYVALTPGNQAVFTTQGVAIHPVDTDAFTAWKTGYFYFNDADIYTVLEQFARWYDIDVRYESKASDDLFVGKIPRSANLSTALHVLKASGVNFELDEGRKLTVKPKR